MIIIMTLRKQKDMAATEFCNCSRIEEMKLRA
jgi:hypothetical protein